MLVTAAGIDSTAGNQPGTCRLPANSPPSFYLLYSTQLQGNNPEDRMPAWARKVPRSDTGPGPGSNPQHASSTTTAARRRANTVQCTAGTAVGSRPPAVPRGDSMHRKAGSNGVGAAAAPAAGAGGAAGAKQPAGIKKTEYMGPDGDLVANLERDVLDRSPGIRCALDRCHWTMTVIVCVLAGCSPCSCFAAASLERTVRWQAFMLNYVTWHGWA